MVRRSEIYFNIDLCYARSWSHLFAANDKYEYSLQPDIEYRSTRLTVGGEIKQAPWEVDGSSGVMHYLPLRF